MTHRETAAASGVGGYAALIALAPSIEAKAVLMAPALAAPVAWWLLRNADRWLIAFFVVAFLTPPLPFAIGNSGPHGATLIAAVGLFIGVLRATEWRVQIDGATLSLLGLFGVLLASLPFALFYSGSAVAAASFARVLLFGISVYVFFYVRSGPASGCSRTLIRVLLLTAVGSAVFALIDFYYQLPAPAGYGPQFVWLDTGVFRRAQGFFYEASTLGNFCAFLLVMIAVSVWGPRASRVLPLWVLLGGGVVLATALVLSYSRASLLNLGIAVCALVFVRRKSFHLSRLLGVATLGVAGAWLLLASHPEFGQLYWQRISNTFVYFAESPDGILSGRLRNWALLQDFLIANPWHAVVGIGYKTLPYSDFVGGPAIADNTYLSMLVETGLVGLAALCIWHVVVLRKSYRAALSSDSQRSFCGTWMFCFWCGQVVQMLSGDLLTYWRVLPAYLCVFALATREAPEPE